jgi:hypothetical protein
VLFNRYDLTYGSERKYTGGGGGGIKFTVNSCVPNPERFGTDLAPDKNPTLQCLT